jgi:hypothetical protein
MKMIKITTEGTTNSGKRTIVKLIPDNLKIFNTNSIINDYYSPIENDCFFGKRLDSISEKTKSDINIEQFITRVKS